jgi:protein ImuB
MRYFLPMNPIMRCWIAVYLPLLSLQALRPRWCEPLPIAIIDGSHVVAVSRLAAAQGARIGLRAASVQALAPGLVLQTRDVMREKNARDAVAMALLQYTPELAIADDDTLLMDVTASLSVFGGRRRLYHRVRSSVQALGFSPRLAMAPAAQAAWLFAHHHERLRRTVRIETMRRRLDNLPTALLPAAQRHHAWLTGIGCHTLGDVRRLPRAGLRRRTDPDVQDQLDRAYGEAPELFEWVQAPENFEGFLELPYPTEQVDQLVFAAHHLLVQMAGWLMARQRAVSALLLSLEHERTRYRHPPALIEITLAEPAWQEAHLLRLMKERLSRLTLSTAVTALRLSATQLAPFAPPTAQLFPEPGGTPADYHRLVELLVARLGTDALYLPSPEPDHRPEVASQWQKFAEASKKMRAHAGVRFGTRCTERPFWLLEQPLALSLQGHRPFYGSSLHLLSGPERIEAGWWDGALALRDYFVAQGEEGACYWIYRERDAGHARWFLHGLFA